MRTIFESGRRPSERRPAPGLARTALAAVAVLLALASVLGVAAGRVLQEPRGDAPSPASGHAEVIADGVGAMPASTVAWRVTRASAPRPMERPDDRALGFVLADADALQVVNLDTGAQNRLAAGEAEFVRGGARLLRFALGDGPVAYYRLALVPTVEADDDLGDEPVLAGEGFAAPTGNRDLDLIRDVLSPGESSVVQHDDLPILVLATDGEVSVETAGRDSDDEPVTLAAGEAGTFQGPLLIGAGDAGPATFVAAVVGPSVPPVPTQPSVPTIPGTSRATATPRPAATATPSPVPARDASIAITKYFCPVGYEGKVDADVCPDPAEEIEFTVSLDASEFAVSRETDADGRVEFGGLGTGAYTVSEEIPGDFNRFSVNCFAEPLPGAPEPRQVVFTRYDAAGVGLELAAGDRVECTWFNIPADVGAPTGSIALTVQLCPTAATPTEQCDYYAEPGATAVLTGPVRLSTDATSDVPVRIHGVSWVWGEEGGIPFGTYYLDTSGLGVPAEYALDRVDGSLGGSEIGWAIDVNPDDPNALVNVVYVRQEPTGDEDADADGATADQEALYGTDPTNPDTDDDGASDGQEINYGEPGPSPTTADSDGDGLLDGAELNETGTNPTGGDSDGDGLSDGDEVAAGTDPLDADDPAGGDGPVATPAA